MMKEVSFRSCFCLLFFLLHKLFLLTNLSYATGILERNSAIVLKELAKEFPIPIEKSIGKTNEGCTSFQVTLDKLRVKEDAVDILGMETDSRSSVSSDIGDPR